MFPFFIPMSSGGGPGPSGRSIIAFLIAIPLYALILSALFHFTGISLDRLIDQWYFVPAIMAIAVSYLSAVIATAMYFDR